MMTWVAILGGLVLLLVGGELLVRGAVSVAKSFGVSPLLIGLTLVGFGTSTPELVTSITAALNNSPGIAVGNVVGSNTANILLILGVASIIFPLAINPKGFRRDTLALIGSALLCLAVVMHGFMARWVGVVFVLLLIAYIVYVCIQEKSAPDEAAVVAEHRTEDIAQGPKSIVASVCITVVGIALTILGARFLVDGAIDVANGFGISDTIVGLTIVAVGTSLPELVSSVIAALRKHADVAYGNIIGSNIYNIFFILGATSLISPIQIPAQIASLDIWVMLAATGLLVFFARTGLKLQRWEGGLFVLAYAAYTAYLVSIA